MSWGGFLRALNPFVAGEAEAGVLPPVVSHKFGSRYINEVAKKLSGFPAKATGGEILSRLEGAGVVPKGFAEAYLRDPSVTRGNLLEHLSESWLRPQLHYIDESTVLPGSYLVEEYAPVERVRVSRDPSAFVEYDPELVLEHPGGRAVASLLGYINNYAPRVFSPRDIIELSRLAERAEGRVGSAYYRQKFNELVDEIERTLNLKSLREFDPDLVLAGDIPKTERRVLSRPVQPGLTKYGFEQMMYGEEPFELILAPSERVLQPEYTHFGLSDYVHVRGTKSGNDLFVQEIQSDWAKHHLREPGLVPKPPPEVVKKWPAHGVEAVLAYASNLPGSSDLIFADEPLISAIRGARPGTYPAYNEALRYAERRAKELGARAERVPLNELVTDTPEGVRSKPLVVELTPKVKETIKAGGSLLGASGLATARTDDRRPATPLDALDELIQYMFGLK